MAATSTLDVNTRNDSSADIIPISLSSIATPRNTVNINAGTANVIGGNQHNITNYNNTYYSNTAGPSSSSGFTSSASFNDAPLGLLSAHFSGRQDELAQITKALEMVRGNMPTRFGLHAGPGVGKSQVTLALAKESFAQGRYKCIFWITATTVEKLHQGFSKLLLLVGHLDRSDPEEVVRLTAARRWLEDFTSGRWLLILDNVVRETVDFLREYLPRTNNHGNILFTTRTKNVAMAVAHTSGEQHEILELSIPDEKDGARLLLGHFRDGDIDVDEGKAREMVKCVGCLPLAIAQAAAYMRETGSTVDELLTIYNSDQKIDMMKWENDLTTYQEKSVAATFTYQLDDLQRQFPDISNLLKIIAYFDPESIPLQMLTTGASVLSKSQPRTSSDSVAPTSQKTVSFLGKVKNKLRRSHKGKEKDRPDEESDVYTASAEMLSLLALIQSPMGLRNAIAQLQNRSLTKQKGTGQSSSLWMHDLTQFIVLDNTKKGGAEPDWFESAVEIACRAFEQIEDPESPQSWGRCEVLIPHIQSLTIRQGISSGANSSLLYANHHIAEYWQSRGRYGDAEALYNQVISSQEKVLGPEHVNTLAAKNNLAYVYKSQGRYNDAEALYNQVISSQEKLFGPEHVDTLTTKNNLAAVYDSQGRYRDAETLYNQVISSREKLFGPEHVGTLTAKNNLARVYDSQGRYSDAEALYNQVISSREKLLGPEHVNTLGTKNNLALVYNSQGRYSDAEALYNQVILSDEKQLGPDHVNTLCTKNNLAVVYKSQGRYNDAEALFNQVLLSREKVLGPEHVDTLTTKNNLAYVYDSQGRYNDAEVLYNQVLLSREKVLGPEHVNTLNTKYCLASVYKSQGLYNDAEALFNQVLSSREKLLGPEHVNTLNTKYCLASVYNTQDRYTEAEALLVHVLAGYEKCLGPSHPYTQKAHDLLADVYTKQGRLDDAENTQSVFPSPQ